MALLRLYTAHELSKDLKEIPELISVRILLKPTIAQVIINSLASNTDPEFLNIKRAIMVIKEVFDEEWDAGWVNVLRDRMLTSLLDFPSPTDANTDLIRMITEKTDEINVQLPFSNELLRSPEMIWKKIQNDIVIEYNQMAEFWLTSRYDSAYEITLPARLPMGLAQLKDFSLEEALNDTMEIDTGSAV